MSIPGHYLTNRTYATCVMYMYVILLTECIPNRGAISNLSSKIQTDVSYKHYQNKRHCFGQHNVCDTSVHLTVICVSGLVFCGIILIMLISQRATCLLLYMYTTPTPHSRCICIGVVWGLPDSVLAIYRMVNYNKTSPIYHTSGIAFGCALRQITHGD